MFAAFRGLQNVYQSLRTTDTSSNNNETERQHLHNNNSNNINEDEDGYVHNYNDYDNVAAVNEIEQFHGIENENNNNMAAGRFGFGFGSGSSGDGYSASFVAYLKRKFGPRASLVLFSGLLLTFFLLGLLLSDPRYSIQNIVSSKASEHTAASAAIPPVTYNNQTDTDGSVKSHSTKSNSADGDSFFTIVFFGTIFLYILLQSYRVFVRINAMNSASEALPERELAMMWAPNGGTAAMQDNNGQTRSSFLQHLRLSMMRREFTADDYDMLQMLDNSVHPSRRVVSAEMLSTLPTYKWRASPTSNSAELDDNTSQADNYFAINSDSTSNSNSNSNNSVVDISCSICLASYSDGDFVKRLPCMHQFHQDCIDPWLRSKSVCPICKFDLNSTSDEMNNFNFDDSVTNV